MKMERKMKRELKVKKLKLMNIKEKKTVMKTTKMKQKTINSDTFISFYIKLVHNNEIL